MRERMKEKAERNKLEREQRQQQSSNFWVPPVTSTNSNEPMQFTDEELTDLFNQSQMPVLEKEKTESKGKKNKDKKNKKK